MRDLCQAGQAGRVGCRGYHGIRQAGRKPERAVLIEAAQQTSANAVVDDAGAAADHSFVPFTYEALKPASAGARGIGERQARREIMVIPTVISRLSVSSTCQAEGDQWIGFRA